MDFSNNCLTELPDSFCNLQRLYQIKLNNNKLNTIPTGSFSSPALEELYLSGNELEEALFLAQTCPKLLRLRIGFNKLTSLPDLQFERLIELNLAGNTNLKFRTSFLEMQPLVKNLFLSHSNLQGAMMAQALTKLNLRHVNLCNCGINDAKQLPISHWFNINVKQQANAENAPPNLGSLDLSNNAITVTKEWSREALQKFCNLQSNCDVQLQGNGVETADAFFFKDFNARPSTRTKFGFAEMKGPYRERMEDALLLHGDLFKNDNIQIDIFGVFDGHGGTEASSYAASKLPLFLKSALQSAVTAQTLPTNVEGANGDFFVALLTDALKGVTTVCEVLIIQMVVPQL